MKADVAGRAMRLIADGVVEREGVPGLAARVGYTTRHLGRLLVEQLGAGPLALARAQRAHTARIIETTEMGFAGHRVRGGLRQRSAVQRHCPRRVRRQPLRLRGRRKAGLLPDPMASWLLSLAVREPFDGQPLLEFLGARAIPESSLCGMAATDVLFASPTGSGPGLRPLVDRVECRLRLADLRDLGSAVERAAASSTSTPTRWRSRSSLAEDEQLRPWVLKRPGLRVPGHVDGFEVAVRAIVGQQVSVAAARTVLGRFVGDHGEASRRSMKRPTSSHRPTGGGTRP